MTCKIVEMPIIHFMQMNINMTKEYLAEVKNMNEHIYSPEVPTPFNYSVIEKCVQIPSANPCVNFIIDGGEYRQTHCNPVNVRVGLNSDLTKFDSPVGLVSSTVLQATSCQNSLGRERVKPKVLLESRVLDFSLEHLNRLGFDKCLQSVAIVKQSLAWVYHKRKCRSQVR